MNYWVWLALSFAVIGLSTVALYYWPKIKQANEELCCVIAWVNHQAVGEVTALPFRVQIILPAAILFEVLGGVVFVISALGIAGRIN